MILGRKKEWGVVMEKEKLKILEELRRILNNKNKNTITVVPPTDKKLESTVEGMLIKFK